MKRKIQNNKEKIPNVLCVEQEKQAHGHVTRHGKVVYRLKRQKAMNEALDSEGRLIYEIAENIPIIYENGIRHGMCLFLLVKDTSTIYEELKNDKELLDSILGDDLDIYMIGYEEDRFNSDSFVSFYESLQRAIKKWKWSDFPQIVIVKTFFIGREVYLAGNQIITINIEKCISSGYVYSTVDLIKKIKDIVIKEGKTLDNCFSMLKTDMNMQSSLYIIKKIGANVIEIVSTVGKLISYIRN